MCQAISRQKILLKASRARLWCTFSGNSLGDSSCANDLRGTCSRSNSSCHDLLLKHLCSPPASQCLVLKPLPKRRISDHLSFPGPTCAGKLIRGRVALGRSAVNLGTGASILASSSLPLILPVKRRKYLSLYDSPSILCTILQHKHSAVTAWA